MWSQSSINIPDTVTQQARSDANMSFVIEPFTPTRRPGKPLKADALDARRTSPRRVSTHRNSPIQAARSPFMQTVTKKDLIERIADKTDERRSVVKDVIQTFLDEIVDELSEGNRLEFRDFGVFETAVRKARRAQNPRKRQAVWVPQRTTVKFKLGRLLKLKLEALDEQRNTAAQGTPAPANLPVAALKSQQQKARPVPVAVGG